MAVFESKRWVTGAFLAVLLVLCFVAAIAEISGNRNGGTEELQSSSNSSMAARVAEDDESFNKHAVDDPEEVVAMVDMSIRNSTERRKLGFFSCGTGNPIDDCWRCDSNWQKNRKRLADCGIGFGRNAIGGRDGRFYVVTDPGDDDPVNPRPGTLRHAVIQNEPLWIVFKRDIMNTTTQDSDTTTSTTASAAASYEAALEEAPPQPPSPPAAAAASAKTEPPMAACYNRQRMETQLTTSSSAGSGGRAGRGVVRTSCWSNLKFCSHSGSSLVMS